MLVDGCVHAGVGCLSHDQLPERRRVHETQGAIGEGTGRRHLGPVRQARRQREKPDALARQGLRLRPGKADRSLRDERCYLGNLAAIIDQALVGLVADDQRRVGQAREHGFEIAQQRRGIDAAGGVVGRVQDDAASARGDGRGDALNLGQAICVGFDHHHPAAVIAHVEGILGEKGRQQDDLVARVENRFQNDVAGGGRARGHAHLLSAKRQSDFPAQLVRDGRAHLGKPGVGHVAVAVRPAPVHHPAQGRQGQCGRLDLGVAQGEIKDVGLATLLLQARALLEHAPNPRSAFELLGDNLGDSHQRASRSFLATKLTPAACKAWAAPSGSSKRKMSTARSP